MTHVDLDGNTAWELYGNSPQWGTVGNDPGALIAEYRYAPGKFAGVTAAGTWPSSTTWTERTEYLYDSSSAWDPALSYSLPSAEQTGLGRVAEVQEWTSGNPAPTDFTHTTYDPVTGQPASIASNEGQVNYTYDPVTGRKVQMWTGTAGAAGAPDDFAYAWSQNASGQLSAVITLALDGTRYGTFTGVNATTHNPTWSGSSRQFLYAYDAAGNLSSSQQRAGGGMTTVYAAYDDEERLTDLRVQSFSTGQTTFAEHYDLNDDGTRKDATDTRYNADGSVFSQTTVNWAYDADGRLTSEVLTVPPAYVANAPAAYTNVFKFDLDGNRTEEDLSGSQNARITYTYNGNNELLDENRSGDGAYEIVYGQKVNGVIQGGYDSAGNLVQQHRFVNGTNPETDSYTWDLRGRMISATVNGATTNYAYDTDGVRTSETTGSTATYYLNDPANPTGYTKAVEESATKGGAPTRSYVLGLQVEAQADAAHGLLFLEHDGHGSTRMLVNTSGTIVEQYNYDAYGDLLASFGAQASAANALTPWLQPDGLYDPASGWNYNLARWRDGFRFTSMDPTLIDPGDEANANLVIYAGGNSVMYSDPSGRFLTAQVAVTAALIGLGIFALSAAAYIYAQHEAAVFQIQAQARAAEYAAIQEQLSHDLAPSTDPAEIKSDIETAMKREDVHKVLFHYTDFGSAITIEQSEKIKAAQQWKSKRSKVTKPSGAWATDIAPYDLHYTQQDLKDFFSLTSAEWFVAVSNDDNGFQSAGYNAWVKWPNIAPKTPVPVKVVWIGENGMAPK